MKKIIFFFPVFLFACDPVGVPDLPEGTTSESGESTQKEQFAPTTEPDSTFELPIVETTEEEQEDEIPDDFSQYVDSEGNCIPQAENGDKCMYKSDEEIIASNYRFCENTCKSGLSCQLIKGENFVGMCFPEEYVEDGK